MHDQSPPIGEAVSLLTSYAPDTLQSLRVKFPDLEAELEPGGVAGLTDEHLRNKADVARQALEVAMEICQRGIAEGERRLRLHRNLRLAGELTSAVGSTSVIGSLAVTSNSSAVASGVISLLGSIAALLSGHFARTNVDNKPLVDVYAEMVTIRADAALLLAELEFWLGPKAPAQSNDLAKTVGKSNALFRRANQLSALLELAGRKTRRP